MWYLSCRGPPQVSQRHPRQLKEDVAWAWAAPTVLTRRQTWWRYQARQNSLNTWAILSSNMAVQHTPPSYKITKISRTPYNLHARYLHASRLGEGIKQDRTQHQRSSCNTRSLSRTTKIKNTRYMHFLCVIPSQRETWWMYWTRQNSVHTAATQQLNTCALSGALDPHHFYMRYLHAWAAC
jgi:hypothetical protein